jgi:replication-associated recombination protein RarA
VRNIVEQAAAHRDMRISIAGQHDVESLITLTAADIAEACNDLRVGRAAGKRETAEDVLGELDAQIGQPQLKQQVRAIVAQARVQQAKQEQGIATDGMALEHLLFTGPPGTGKTTIARLLARLYRALGVLTNDGIVEVNQSTLVAGYKGQTAIQTRGKIDEAMGGVLFIDEAYTLVAGEHSFGQEAIDELLPRLENDRGRFVAIAAGYPDEMKRFVDSNVGLQSRFTTTIEFLPYTADELVQIAQSMAARRAEHLTDGAVEVLRERLTALEHAGGFTTKAWGNARSVRNVLDRAVQRRDLRVSEGDLTADPEMLITVTEADMIAACDLERLSAGAVTESVEDVLSELDAQIGQPQLKQQVRALLAQARMAQRRQQTGQATGRVPIEHLLFVGPPGTGKTTIARLIGRLYRALGLLPKGDMVEVDRTGLVAGYIGHTAKQTTEKIDAAMGGVLFIDEAYTLVKKDDPRDFGREAIETLLPRLENDKGKFLAIAAGYPEEMTAFLDANPGLKSRFTTTIEFQPYTADELVQIAQGMAVRRAERLTDGAVEVMRQRITAMEQAGAFNSRDWGNARTVRNLVDRAAQLRDLRLSDDEFEADVESVVTITETDMAAACDRERLAVR